MPLSAKIIPCAELRLPEKRIAYNGGHCIKAELRINRTDVFVELINSDPPHVYISIGNQYGLQIFTHGEPAEELLKKAIKLLPRDRVMEIFANLARDKLLADE